MYNGGFFKLLTFVTHTNRSGSNFESLSYKVCSMMLPKFLALDNSFQFWAYLPLYTEHLVAMLREQLRLVNTYILSLKDTIVLQPVMKYAIVQIQGVKFFDL